jgi:hypothetical protein
MQTFMPSDFYTTATALDDARLKKQVVEAMQILTVLEKNNPLIPWAHHPAVLMWTGYERALKYYIDCLLDVCKNRGINFKKIKPFGIYHNKIKSGEIQMPIWINCYSLQQSHKNALLYKNREHYITFFNKPLDIPAVPVNGKLPYIWPSKCAQCSNKCKFVILNMVRQKRIDGVNKEIKALMEMEG